MDELSLRCFTLDILFSNYSVTNNFISPILDGFKKNCSIITLFANLNREVLQQLVLFFPIWSTFWKCIAMQYSVLYERTQILEYEIHVYIFSIGVSENIVFWYYSCFTCN